MELLKSYADCKKETENFTKVESEMLIRRTDYIEIIRKLCGLTNIDMEKIYFGRYGKRFRSSNWELYPDKHLGKKVAERLASIFSLKLTNIKNRSFESILSYNERTRKNRESFVTGNLLEDEVEKLLKERKVKFERHSRIVGKSGIFHKVDFLLESRFNPRIVIEVKKSRSMKHNSMMKAKELASTAFDVKRDGMKFIVILDTDWSKGSLKFLKYYCDEVIHEKDIESRLAGLLI